MKIATALPEVATVRTLYVRFAAEAVTDDAKTTGLADATPAVPTYSVTREGGAWRVPDIDYGPGRPSLRQLLTAPEPPR